MLTASRMLTAASLALVAACGSGAPVDDAGDVPLDEPAPVVDAAADPIPDAGEPVDASEPPPAAQCAPDSGVAYPAPAACWTLDELAAHGCRAVLVGTATAGSGSSTTVLDGTADAAKAAHFALNYITTAAVTLYLCSSPAPADGWQCVSHTLSDCAASTTGGTCSSRVVVPALPTLSAVCARAPS